MIDYDATILNFFKDVSAWLNARLPRDMTEVKDIENTQDMWKRVSGAYTKKLADKKGYNINSEELIEDYLSNSRGLMVKRDVLSYDNSVFCAVYHMLLAIDECYLYGSDFRELKLAEKLKAYKLACAKNALTRFKLSLTKPQKLLSIKQR